VSKFYDDPMVNESKIVVSLGQIWVYVGKEKAQCEGHLFCHRHYFRNPNGGFVQRYVPSPMLKFHDDPTVKKSKIIVLLRQSLSVCGKRKREGFGRGSRENEFERKRNRRDVFSVWKLA